MFWGKKFNPAGSPTSHCFQFITTYTPLDVPKASQVALPPEGTSTIVNILAGNPKAPGFSKLGFLIMLSPNICLPTNNVCPAPLSDGEPDLASVVKAHTLKSVAK